VTGSWIQALPIRVGPSFGHRAAGRDKLLVLKDTWPDLTIVLDIDPAVSLKRISGKKDRLENEA